MVLDSDGRLEGIVSLADIAVDSPEEELSAHTLEEVSKPAEPRRHAA